MLTAPGDVSVVEQTIGTAPPPICAEHHNLGGRAERIRSLESGKPLNLKQYFHVISSNSVYVHVLQAIELPLLFSPVRPKKPTEIVGLYSGTERGSSREHAHEGIGDTYGTVAGPLADPGQASRRDPAVRFQPPALRTTPLRCPPGGGAQPHLGRHPHHHPESLESCGPLPGTHFRYPRSQVAGPRGGGISADDSQQVLGYAIRRLGNDYDLRQLLDLARFLLPWSIFPRRWRSSLFQHNAGDATRTVCSTLLAEAFSEVDFPILPFIDRGEDGSLRLFKRNPKLFAPRDFDYSPYFSIIKYPFLGMNDVGLYRRLPWDREAPFHDQQPPHRTDTQPAPREAPASPLRRAFGLTGIHRKEI